MRNIIVAFIRLLRDAGVPVTSEEAADCLRVIASVGFDISLLRTLMEITLVKSQWEYPIFQTAFDLYFMGEHTGEAAEMVKVPLVELPAGSTDGSGQGTAGAGGAAYNLLICVDGKPLPVLETLARFMAGDLVLQQGDAEEIEQALRQIQVAWGWFGAVNIIERRLQKRQIDEQTYQHWMKQFAILQQNLRQTLQHKAIQQFGRDQILQLVAYTNLRRRDFSQLSEHEAHAIEQEIVRLARRMANKPGIRMRKAKKGKIDISRTLRNVVGTGGCPLRLKYRNKTKSKVDLWLVCDVSNSVERFSRFMLQLIHTAQKRYAHIRTFVFVDRPVDVTEWFRQRDVAEFLQARALRELFSRTGFSRYDLVFQEIARHELSAITSRTKIIILGDGRNNWLPAGNDEFEKIAGRAQAVYWLNPMPREHWRQGDCIMGQYQDYCRQVFECRNVEQLAQVAAQIL